MSALSVAKLVKRPIYRLPRAQHGSCSRPTSLGSDVFIDGVNLEDVAASDDTITALSLCSRRKPCFLLCDRARHRPI
jgi:hypothetical protein